MVLYDYNQESQAIYQPFGSAVYEQIRNDILEVVSVSKTQTYEAESLIKEEQISEQSYVNIATYKLSSQYNFYTDFFEQDIANEARVTERMLPNFYILGDKKYSDFYIHRQLNSLNNNLDIEPNPVNNKMEPEYFDRYSNETTEAVRPESDNSTLREFLRSSLDSVFSNITINNQYLRRLKEINNNQYLMPFYIKVNFKTSGFNFVSSIIDDIGFSDQFLIYLKNLNTTMTRENVFIFTDDTVKQGDEYRLIQSLTEESVTSINFNDTSDFINSVKNNFLNSQTSFYLGLAEDQKNITEQVSNNIQQQIQRASNFKKAILFKMFTKRIGDYFNNNKPSISQFLATMLSENKSSVVSTPYPSEILAYELLKKTTDYQIGTNPGTQNTQETTVQTLLFSHVPTVEEIEYIDSQVKYGKNYKYELYSYNLSTKIVFNTELFNTINAQQFVAIVNNLARTNTTIVEYINKIANSNSQMSQEEKANYVGIILEFFKDNAFDLFKYTPTIFKRKVFSDVMSVFDNPPPSPEVEIDGMMGIDNKIFLRLQSSISEFKAKPVLIQPEDEIKFSKNVINQKLENLQTEMMFDGDDRIQYFQIFKLDYRPKSYQEFKDKFVQVSTTYEIVDPSANYQVCDVLKTNHTSYLDTVQPNTKYYYTFRSIDIHGNISNPGPIYEVEIVNAEGTIFTLVKVVDLLKEEDKQMAKPAKRFLYISPTAMQTLVNERASGYFQEDGDLKNSAELVSTNVVLGLTDERIWNKNFRLKIRSKTTGKLIEIDFKFIHEALTKKIVCK